jgi:hypothetical protein
MAAPAQRQQIFQSVVSGVFGRGNAVAVNVVNLQIIFAAAVLACVLVSLQSGFPIAAEVCVVFVLFAYSLVVLWVGSKPFVDSAHVELALAFGTPVLNTGAKHEVITAIRALLDRAFKWATSGKHFGLTGCFGLSFLEVFGAAGAGFLRRASRRVAGSAHHALPINKPAAGLPVGLQSARLASPHVGGGFVNCRAAIRAVEGSVFSHCASRNKNAHILT